MTAVSLVPPRVAKELRGLLPTFAISVVTISVTVAVGGFAQVLGVGTYWLGAAALGALSMGQEYNGRTLSLLLSQPARRERLYLEKLGVLAALLLLLSAVTVVSVAVAARQLLPGFYWKLSWGSVSVWLPLACAFLLAPWLTMVCRSALAGMVFALAVPGVIWIAGKLAAVAIYGGELSQTVAARALFDDIFLRGTLIASVLGGVAGWWQFQRLEAIESRNLEIHAPVWLTRLFTREESQPPATRRHPLWLLLRKELRLQQLAFAFTGFYIVSWISLLLFDPLSSATRTTMLYVSTVIHSVAVPLLAGSLTSAEERQMGTISWQTLLPMAAWKQWLTKSAVALSVTLLLTLVVPALLLSFTSSAQIRSEIETITSDGFAFAIVAVVVTSLYVSSLCGTGLRALLISLPVALVMLDFTRARFRWYSAFDRMWYAFRDYPYGDLAALYWRIGLVITVLMFGGALVILTRAALANHRSAERGARRVWKQLAGLAAFLMVAGALRSGVFRLEAAAAGERMRAWRQTRSEVSGTVLDASNHPVAEFVVAMFSEEYSQRETPITFRRKNAKGEFKANWLPPGEYIVVAVRRLESRMERDPEVIDRLRSLGTAVTLAPGESKTLSLTLAGF